MKKELLKITKDAFVGGIGLGMFITVTVATPMLILGGIGVLMQKVDTNKDEKEEQKTEA